MGLISTPWTRQPQIPVGVNWRNPFTERLNVATTPVTGGAGHRAILGGAITVTGVSDVEATAHGLSKRGGPGKYTSSPAVTSLPPFSLFFSIIPRGLVGDSSLWTLGNTATEGAPRLLVDISGTSLRFFFGGSYRINISSALSVGVLTSIGFTHDGTIGLAYINGREVGSAVSAMASGSALNWWYQTGYSGQSNSAYFEQFQWSRVLSAAEMLSLSANPWQLFAPLERRIRVPVTAAGVPALSAALLINATSNSLTPRVTAS